MTTDTHAHDPAHMTDAAHTQGPRHGAHAGHAGHAGHGLHGGGGEGATGTIKSISGASFVVATKQGEVTVTTDADTNFHTPGVSPEAKRAGYDGYHELTFSALRVGQRVGVMGERRDNGTLHAQRVHLPKP